MVHYSMKHFTILAILLGSSFTGGDYFEFTV